MRSLFIFFFSLFIIGIQLISADDLTPEEVFTQASKEIDKNNYDKALSLLNSLVTENHIAPEVFFQPETPTIEKIILENQYSDTKEHYCSTPL